MLLKPLGPEKPTDCGVGLVLLLLLVLGCGGDTEKELKAYGKRLGSENEEEATEAASRLERAGMKSLAVLRRQVLGKDPVAGKRAVEVGSKIIADAFEDGWKRELAQSWLTTRWPDSRFAVEIPLEHVKGAVVLLPGKDGGITFDSDLGRGRHRKRLADWGRDLKERYTESEDPRLSRAIVLLGASSSTPWSRLGDVLNILKKSGIWQVFLATERGMNKSTIWCLRFALPLDMGLLRSREENEVTWGRISLEDGIPLYHVGGKNTQDEKAFMNMMMEKPFEKAMKYPAPDPDVAVVHFIRWYELWAKAHGIQPGKPSGKEDGGIWFELELKKNQ